MSRYPGRYRSRFCTKSIQQVIIVLASPHPQPFSQKGEGRKLRTLHSLCPTLPKVDKIHDPCNRVEAENREQDPSPVVALCEEPCEECVNNAADDHRSSGFKKDAEKKATNERHKTKIITPPEGLIPCMAAAELTIEKERHDNWYNRHAKNDADERKGDEIGFERGPGVRGEIGTDR